MMMIRRRSPVVLMHEPVQVRHREKLGISTREIDSRNPQARSPSFTMTTYLSQNLFVVYNPKNGVFENDMTWILEEKTKLSFFLDDNHNTSIDALIFDNCYWFISSLWKLSRFIWKINAKISSKYQYKIELSSLVFRWIKIRSNNQDLYLGVDRRPWGEWAGWVSRVSKALKTKRFYTKLWWKIGSSCC